MVMKARILSSTEINPTKFYELVDIANRIDASTQTQIVAFVASAEKVTQLNKKNLLDLQSTDDAVKSETRRFERHNRGENPFDPASQEDLENRFRNLKHSIGGQSFLTLILDIYGMLDDVQNHLLTAARGVKPMPVVLVGDRITGMPKTMEELQTLSIQMDMNQSAIAQFINGVRVASCAEDLVYRAGSIMVEIIDRYYDTLIKRHTTGGVKIHGDPITTDLAISIFENVDANGEIQEGRSKDEVSAYSVRKAVTIIEGLNNGLIGVFIENPRKFTSTVCDLLEGLWASAAELAKITAPLALEVERITSGYEYSSPPFRRSAVDLKYVTSSLRDLDPSGIVYKEKTGLLTLEERKAQEQYNETLGAIAAMLRNGGTANDIVAFVLERKESRRKYELEENSFYVCKIGAGNSFLGEAPGQLTIVPGVKPNVTLDEIVGSGFNEVRTFIDNITDSAEWFDLFVATSPSKKADKSNTLLVGPQGCGKSEVLRAVASLRNSVGIFAQASDFLTCWKGEAEKNPKRLFEAGLKLQRESGKMVYFLIDEIDTILNGDRGQAAFGGTNLATEFQVLMDGITTYPNLAIWGATNHPERIPMPLMRRFAKVLIVGELSQADRVKLLKQFTGYLPIQEGFPEKSWEEAAEKLKGAVGDVMRKVTDGMWRQKMSSFVSSNPDKARELLKFLNPDGGVKFSVSDFKKEQRQEFQRRLRPFVSVSPADLMSSVDNLLNNMAIQAEIQTCVETYDNARAFVAGMTE